MGFLDKVTKAVGDVVDKGKKDVDQFVKIQKLNGEISGFEKKIETFKGQIGETTRQAGARTLELMRAGSLTSPELQTFLDQVIGFEQQIAGEQGNIAAKKEEIERVKAEHDAAHAAAIAPAQPLPPVVTSPAPVPPVPAAPVVPSAAAGPVAPSAAAGPVAPPPIPAPAADGAPKKFCPQCGALQAGGAFCGQCGAKLG